LCGFAKRQRFVERTGHPIAVAGFHAPLNPPRIDFDREANAAVERDRQRLRAAHAAEAAGDHEPAGEVAAEMFFADRRERFKRALHDALRADVNPRASGHLAIHHQARGFERVEVFPGGPVADQIRVCNEHARGLWMRAENGHRLARLHEERFVVGEPLQLAHDGVKCRPVPRRLAASAVNDEFVRPLGHGGVEVVHQTAQRGFLMPATAGNFRAVWSADDRR
jgi:hypothetical protein